LIGRNQDDAMMWEVHHDGKVRKLTEAKLRSMLQKNKLAGVELARRKGDDAWAPLYTTEIYRQAVVHTGNPAVDVRNRLIQPFLVHVATFASVLGALWFVSGSPPFWGAFWGIGLFFHGLKTVRGLGQLPSAQQTAPTRAAPQSTTAPALLPDNEVLRAIEDLDQAGWSGDTQALRDTATLLMQRRTLVDDATDGEAKEALQLERAAVLTDRDGASDSTRALLDDQLNAIDARLSFLHDIQQHGIRLRAQERTLLHQVESLRLGQIRASEDTAGPDLMQAVTRLRRELDAESEVTDALARARQASRQ
jgi:hypothetical protein